VRFGVRHKLIILGTLVILVVSSGFTWANLALARRAIEEDLRARAIVYARDIAATLGHGSELSSRENLQALVTRLTEIRKSVLQLDVIAFRSSANLVVATNNPATRIPFSEADADEMRRGGLVLRLATEGGDRYWQVMAPVELDGVVAGAVAVNVSTIRGDELTSRIRWWALTLTAVSIVVMGVLMSASIQLVVDRPIRSFMQAIATGADDGVPAPVGVRRADEFGVLALHFNEMVSRIQRFNDELKTRIGEATGELDRRYHELEQLNGLLFEMQRRMGRAERLALSGRVMAEVAHEVGTPLHSVAGHLELLRKDLAPTGDDVARRLTIIETQVARVIDIIARLLDVTRHASGDSAPVDLERLARDTADLVRPTLASARLTLDVRTAPSLPPVQGRADQLQQVILNLLTNAIDATPPGGRIEITTHRLGAGELEIAVADTGRGISVEHRRHLFEPFFSTKEPGHGAGLGLFISDQIVREHKGRIEIESEEGRGSTFHVFLPAVERA
jgi:two-component system, NtrC family, sensor kinase